MATDPLVKKVNLKGLTERDAQEHAQKVVAAEFLDQTITPMYRLMVNYATGTGKGKAAIETTSQFYDTVSRRKVLFGVWTESQRDNVWPKQFAQWGRMHPFMSNMRTECYASFHNIKGEHFGMVVLDEAQHLTELGYSFFENNKVDGVLILTATEPKDPEKKHIIKRITYGRRLIIDADTAIDAKIINDFEVVKVLMELDNTEEYKMFKTTNTLYTDWTGYLKHCALVDAAIRSRDQMRIRFTSIARQRFVGNCKSKRLAAEYIQNQFRAKKERFITIAAGIEQCNLLSEHVFHSESDDRHYKAFAAGKINELVSIKQIREGENFDNLGRGLIVQVDKNANNTVQILGRLLRLAIGEISRAFILVAKDTMDEGKWVPSALADTNPNKIRVMHLDKSKYWK